MSVRIGVEEEFHVLEVESGLLVPHANSLLRRLPRRTFTTELHQSTVESNSEVHTSLDDLYADLAATRRQLDAAASSLGLAAVAGRRGTTRSGGSRAPHRRSALSPHGRGLPHGRRRAASSAVPRSMWTFPTATRRCG